MATVLERPPAAPPPAPAPLKARHPARADRGFRYLALGCGLLVLVILALIALSLITKAWPVFRDDGSDFFFTKTWDPANNKFGALAFAYGTLVTSTIALAVGVPVSIGIALLLTEVAPLRMRMPVVYLIDLLAAVPSVVFGLWGLLVLAKPIDKVYGHFDSWFAHIPVLNTLFSGGGHQGTSLMTAGLILALMITPIVTSLSREVFATVPVAQKEAALALGATRWEMIRASVLSYGRSGVVGAVMLGLGRAMGETIAVALLVGSSAQITGHLFRPGDTMAGVIANQFGEATGTFRAALLGLGVVLFAITILVNLGARAVLNRSERQLGGAL
ncbi:MAG TPA: phosphate ABC transporter permease subunit PstC [Acidimicrobiales bacterium]|nr:phosphate ABC transporter permease subunit PstC [Acidimicrobiales bacterium]